MLGFQGRPCCKSILSVLTSSRKTTSPPQFADRQDRTSSGQKAFKFQPIFRLVFSIEAALTRSLENFFHCSETFPK